jgi:sigma-B regulation protein RsbU (phosphoserine phosphatase)
MKEIFTVFRSKKAWGHMVLSAVVFFAIALPFRSLFTLLPGVTEIRPANMVPLVFGIQFGPAAAWGISIGNLISDILSGSNAFVCATGFVINFFYTYIPYKLWYTLRLGKEPIHPVRLYTVLEIAKYILVVFIDSLVTTVSLSLIFEAAGFQSFFSSFPLLFFNNFDFAIILGIPVLSFWSKTRLRSVVPEYNEKACPRQGLLWRDIPLIIIPIIGVVYFLYSMFQGGETINSWLALVCLCAAVVGLLVYAFRPTGKVEPLPPRREGIKISIKAKVTIGFLLITLVFLVLLAVVSFNALNVGGELSRLEVWNYIYLVLGITINLLYGIAIAFLWYVEKNITTPVERLSYLTELYAKQEHGHDEGLAVLLRQLADTVPKGDEIGALAVSFRNMMDELDDYMVNLAAVTADKERIATELNVATQIQASMLPCIFPAFPGRDEFDIYASMMPAKEVGGDFYDFFLVDQDHLAVVMADVSGKGVPAALFMVIAKTLIKNQAQQGHSPAEVFTAVNNQLCENNEAGLFVTSWMGILDINTGEFTYVNAGHNPPLLMRSGGDFEYLRSRPGFVLAGMEGIRYRQATMKLGEGDVLYLYTDGVTEATNGDNEQYGEERLLSIVNQHKEDTPQELLPTIKADIDRFVGDAPQFDDITMLGLKIKIVKEEGSAKS